MALQVWLPFTKNYDTNQGLSNDKFSSTATNVNILSDMQSPLHKGCLSVKNGSSGIKIPASLLNNLEEASVAMWVYPSVGGSSYGEYFCATHSGYFNFSWYNNKIYLGTTKTGFGQSAPRAKQLPASAQATARTWQHICLTFNRGEYKAYSNGNLCLSGNTGYSDDSLGNSYTSFYIGGFSSTYQFSGMVSDFRFYDNAITDYDVKRLYQQKIYELVPYDGFNNVLFDRSGIINMPIEKNHTAKFVNNALYFNGNSKLRPKNGNIGFTMDNGTLSVWFTIETSSTNFQIIYIDSVSKFAIGIVKSSNTIITTCNGTGNKTKFTGASIKYDGSINNIIVSYNTGKTPQFMLINGVSVGTNGSDVWTETSGLTIGNRMYNSAQSGFKGNLFKVSVYNKQFTRDEAMELYNLEKEMFLPVEYAFCKNISSTENGINEYIDTGIIPNEHIKIETEFKISANAHRNFFGCYSEEGIPPKVFYKNFYLSSAAGTKMPSFYFSYGNIETINLLNRPINTVTRFIIDFKNGIIMDNDSIYNINTTSIGNVLPSSTIKIFTNSDDKLINQNQIAFKYFKIYDNDVLIMNLIPAKRKEDNLFGMYDMITKEFFYGSGTFIEEDSIL